MSDSTRIFFYGVLKAGEVGHYLYSPCGFSHFQPADLPWRRHELDGGLTWNSRWPWHSNAPSKQGDAALRYKDGWTAISWHDYTGDSRGGSTSTVVACGTFTLAEMWSLFERHFPQQHARQPGTLMLRHEDPRPW